MSEPRFSQIPPGFESNKPHPPLWIPPLPSTPFSEYMFLPKAYIPASKVLPPIQLSNSIQLIRIEPRIEPRIEIKPQETEIKPQETEIKSKLSKDKLKKFKEEFCKKHPKKIEECRNIMYVFSNDLPKQKEKILKYFKKFPDFKEVRFIPFKKFAFVEFRTETSMLQLLENNILIIDNITLEIELSMSF